MDFKNTSDFVSGFWNIYVVGLTLASVIGCGVLLWIQGAAKHSAGQTTGHVWDDDLEEYNNPLPSWWRWMFYLTVVFALVYLALYPGLGTYGGSFSWTMRGQYEKESQVADERFVQAYGPLLKMSLAAVAADPRAKEAGQRLFLTYCAQCHGADAKGTRGFPNLTDSDWLWGGSPEQIKETILKGRDAMMPAKGLKPDLTTDQIRDLAHYVRSLSGLTADSVRVQRGQELFAPSCGACHGPEGKGTVGMAPNLTDKVWLYSSSEDVIVETITKGRQNRMPAFGEFLGDAKVHLLAAYVYGLGGGAKATPPSADPVVPEAK
ncbi:cytochrome-c oxidase, cbb3-type subunit III [Denitratisoma oestradiolicum]|uniref:Cbb3-type cytochrome c oxidase subunit n=1 Tax=Denitratisoma oestradiolicum TaxID=311182 RepID=A0A6S6XUF5_9PROT|nr:cytochrome-c oxidase, cbb3-type subunit III [Denitratisoma oestradiolicum]TWO79905.1 cytochrome-c oxidase, cbb3-type subunit III [Denitratisoma oestradiolicum]CAB1369660.1 Cbb3-type cytochrome c oxidase subunit CcoP2 [Denitratisoma oestradiolicum]